MRVPGFVAILLMVALEATSATAQSPDFDARFKEAVAARLAGDIDKAEGLLGSLVLEQPDNADVQVQLGFVMLAKDEREAAETAFAKALAVAPDYVDANLGLAIVAFRRGDYDRAEAEAKKVLAVRADPEAEALLLNIAAARAAADREPPPVAGGASGSPVESVDVAAPEPGEAEIARRWRVDFNATFSDLPRGYADWYETSLRIGYAITPDTTLIGAAEFHRRFDRDDIYLEARLDHQFAEALAAYGFLGGTPDADFRPTVAYGGGFAYRFREGGDVLDAGFLTLDLSDAHYTADRVLTVTPGFQQYFFGARTAITARWINTFPELSTHHMGYLLRGDWQATDRLLLFAGYSDAPDTSEGVTVDVRSVFGGAFYAVNDRATLRSAFSYEDRSRGYDRSSVSLGLGLRY